MEYLPDHGLKKILLVLSFLNDGKAKMNKLLLNFASFVWAFFCFNLMTILIVKGNST